ncbi:MAG: hypothetical protein AB9915_01580 [Candidatus Dojkabacteria bacterium]
MLKTEKQPKSINFLEAVYSPNDIWSNAYIWLTEVGKYLLIFVEVIVLGVFFSRFILDRKNNDLTEQVNSQVILLSNDTWRKNSILFENYQTLFSDIRKIRMEQDINSIIISELISGVPSSLNLESLSYNEKRVSFQIRASSLEAVKNYESALKSNPDYYDVKFSINKDSTEISVVVSFALNPIEKKK